MRLENLHGYLKFPGPFPVASIRLKFVARGAAASRFVPREDGGAVSPDEPDTGADAALSEVPDRDRAVEVAGLSPDMLPRQGELDLGGNDPQLRHLDHAWASTVHAFQGRTVDNVIAAMEARHPHLTTQKSFYVEISRARDRAELVTDDAGELRAQLQAATGERIAALEGIGEMEREAPEKSVEVERAAEGQPVHGAGRDTGKERDGPPSSPKDPGFARTRTRAAARTGTSDCDTARPERDDAGRNIG